MSEIDEGGELKTIKIDDRQYDLHSRRCDNCNEDHYEVWRWSGSSFSRYFMPGDFQPDYFEHFVEHIDQALLMTAADAIQEFARALNEVNFPKGIVADSSFSFRLLEYGRHRVIQLQKLRAFDALLSEQDPKNDHDRAVRAAFELGMATAEHRILDVYEDYIWEGLAVEEWRAAGLPRAREERLRQGLRSRTAIVNAAKKLYDKNPALIRNDSETARLILKERLPELQKGNGIQVGLDAITRHLRASRKCDTTQGAKTSMRQRID